ncbi:tRNA guanosine(34) transglycosylase Tgt [Candidatus Falkowbacteria bacterium]|jgi:queuine tRNA-ribosyltransferase|nr:tRNA guanosine(34) transglycosylase Tgt [Candidatus Falkowbacteria bacterium]MBT7007394.1 tRNA guanosine(34) transglycosylase Tgt [Candidatus Falkowbacteria bacterium]
MDKENFKLKTKNKKARTGTLETRRGKLKTPFFMPIATKGAVKTLSIDDINQLDPGILLSNTYHLMLRPGEKEIQKLGGLHDLMKWDGPILTDSGGFQVFSLGKIRKIYEEGVEFSSHIDGRKFQMTPEDSIRIQKAIGSDIMMVLDECVELPAKKEYLEKSIELTTSWASKCKKYHQKKENGELLFGIVQGGLDKELRKKSAEDLVEIGFDGYAIGGLSVGESEEQMYKVLDYICDELPENKPRYLMGVGYPHQIVEAVKRGVDMFDCVIPTREARHGRLYLFTKKKLSLTKKNDKSFYTTINSKAAKFQFDLSPINPDSKFEMLRTYSKAYLRHLFTTDEPLAQRLATLNNLEFYLELMRRIRKTI